jgi:TolB-like protein/class 3 adenylate cyclase/Flp pilus assembly protein TadD
MTSPSTITLVFSDIEHSTRLAQQLKHLYPEFLEKYRTVIRDAIKKYGGQEIDTAGDGFFMTFVKPQPAIIAIANIQKQFHAQKWAADIGLKVRMGIHTGAALMTESGYTGPEVHLASRICNAAHGGQVILSASTNMFLDENLIPEISSQSLGSYTLKDFDTPNELFQLIIPGASENFPPPRISLEEKRIAVLPFENLTKDQANEYLGNGMAEEIIVALGKIKGLRVASRSSSFAIKDEGRDPLTIGDKLSVHSVLDGRIKANNGSLRVSVELIDTNSALNLWAESYHCTKEEIISVQKKITREISKALQCKVEPEQLSFMEDRQSHNVEAYDYYLRGRRFYLQFSVHGIELAIRMFQKAIEADNNYALAYAGIADCYSFLFQHQKRSSEIINKADEASKKAVELSPSIAEVYVSRGIVLAQLQEYDKAEDLFLYAVEIDPTNFLAWFHYGRTCYALGKLAKAARFFEQANRVEPEDYQSLMLSAQAYDGLGFHELAYTLRHRGVEIAERWLELNPGDTRALYFTANALVFLNQKERSLRLLNRAMLLDPDDSMLLYNAGCIYALLGMETEALSCLESSYKAGLTLRGWYENDNNLDGLRDHPRFIKLMDKMSNDPVE